jgi:predicted nucleotidyltransferase
LTKIKAVFANFLPIEKVWLYGSRAKGNYQPYSDIDIALEGELLDSKTQHQIEWALDDLYLPYTFDVSILSHIKNEDLLNHINRVGIVLYEREEGGLSSDKVAGEGIL